MLQCKDFVVRQSKTLQSVVVGAESLKEPISTPGVTIHSKLICQAQLPANWFLNAFFRSQVE